MTVEPTETGEDVLQAMNNAVTNSSLNGLSLEYPEGSIPMDTELNDGTDSSFIKYLRVLIKFTTILTCITFQTKLDQKQHSHSRKITLVKLRIMFYRHPV